jgi:hypothetical protein
LEQDAQAFGMRSPAKAVPEWRWLIPGLVALALGAIAWDLLSRPSPTQSVATLPPTMVETPVQRSGGAIFIVKQDEVKNWVGRPVFSRDNTKIGEIIEIRRDPDNKVTEAYIDTGDFLGLGGTRYRVTSDQIQEIKPDGLLLTLKASEIRSLPPGENQKQ